MDLGPRKQRALLAVLLLRAGEIVPTDRLIELVWGDRAPRTAAHSVQIYVSGLRRALEPVAGEIVTRPPGYALEVDPDTVDTLRFQRLVADPAADPAPSLREALALWRGDPLADFAYEEFAQEPIRRLQVLRLDALEALAAVELGQGRAQETVAIVESAIPDDPHRERLRELEMIALYRCGRHPDALRAYQRFHRLLGDELGLEPSPSLQRLNERVLLHDPSLTVQATAAAAPIRNPYKGLRPFGEDDAGDFFGRSRLVAEILSSLEAGNRLIALIGPSGCGKSSVLRAGLIPRLRATWDITTMVPGADPLERLERALAGAGDGRLLLAVDQFEELFTLSDDATAAAFLNQLTTARATVVLTLRADFYDRPLLHAHFAPHFTAGVINVLPMMADEIEAAIVGPARRVGVDVDPTLLAELVADTTDQRGALPLLQYTLTELFEQRNGAALELREYRRAGGLRALLSKRSEESYQALDEQQRDAALQAFLRLVNLSDDARPSRRRAPVRELTALDVDPVALSAVLDEFGRHRLLAFDRDAATGDAVVEVAHEALLWEWDRLAGWCDAYRDDLRRHRSLAAMAAEWESTDRHPDYLITGGRLAEFEAWTERTPLRLNTVERAFLDSALEHRRAEQADQRRLERRAARRLWALAAAVLVLAGAATLGVVSWLGSRPPNVSLVWYGGDNDLDYALGRGFDRAVPALGIDAEKRAVAPENLGAELRTEAERGVDFVVMTGPPGHDEALDVVAQEYPKTRFVTFDFVGDRANVAYMTFADHEGSFLAGVAAALKSRTGTIGFIGGADFEPTWRFHAGYEAGARAVDPDIRVREVYLSRLPDISGFDSFAFGRREAERLYRNGVDVIYHAAGVTGYGVIDAAFDLSRALGTHLWAIGSVNDLYRAISILDPAVFGTSPNARRHVLTAMVKRIDRAVYTALADYKRGALASGVQELGLAERGVELSRSGGFIDDISAELERFRDRIISGEIEVPTVPESRRNGS